MRLLKSVKYILLFMLSWAIFLPGPAAESAQQSETVRVVLAQQSTPLHFIANGDYQLVYSLTGQKIADISNQETWQVRLQNEQLFLQSAGKEYGPFKEPVTLQENNVRISVLAANGNVMEKNSLHDLVVLNAAGQTSSLTESNLYVQNPQDKKELSVSNDSNLNLITLRAETGQTRYRGDLEFRVESGMLLAINQLHVEDYLRGVVPAEMPSGWPLEALKAQAIISRNYALQRAEIISDTSYDLTNDQLSQVYAGYDAETSATDRAVEETAGMVMLHQGQLISAFFHSSSGGFIENSEDVWLDTLPFIKHKEDPYDLNNLHYDWQVHYTDEQLLEILNNRGYQFQYITAIDSTYTASGARIKKLVLNGMGTDNKTLQVELANADQVRIALGLKSSLVTLREEYDKEEKLTALHITGNGWGHGLGLSQWGANSMAKEGYTFRDILQYYYTDIVLVDHYGGY